MIAKIPITWEFSPEMGSAISEVLFVDYGPVNLGEQLTVQDIGANVGFFDLCVFWA
jgi:hypothetical protein